MPSKTFMVCDRCEAVAIPNSDVEIVQFVVEGPDSKARVTLCKKDRSVMDELMAHGEPVRRYRTMARSSIRSIDDAPRL